MNTATVYERPTKSEVGMPCQFEYEKLLFAALRRQLHNLGQGMQEPETYHGQIIMPNIPVVWDEDVKTVGVLSTDRFSWNQLEQLGRQETPIYDRPAAWIHFLADRHNSDAFRVGLEIAGFHCGLEQPPASTATNFWTLGACTVLAVALGCDAMETGSSIELVEGEFRVTARATVLPRPTQGQDPVPVQTLRALERIKQLPDNWDGDGASRIEEATVSKAERLIREAFRASPNKLKPPSIAPGFGGMIVAEWSGTEGRELILDIPPGGEAPGFLLVEPLVDGDEIETDGVLGPSWSMRHLITRLNGE